MPRTLTEDGSGNLTFQERATDVDQDQITAETVELNAIDGVGQTGASRTPAWLSHTTTFNPGDPSEMLIDVTLVASQLSVDTTYTFLFEVSDGIEVTQRTVDLVVKTPSPFSDKGTKMFLFGNDGSIQEYNLSTPFDISTTTLESDVGNSTDTYGGFEISDDGTKVFMVNFSNNSVEEYILSTPFDTSTKSFNQENNINSSESSPFNIVRNADGSKFYIFGSSNNEIVVFDLSTPYDVSTMSLNKKSAFGHLVRGMEFKPDGTKFFITDGSNDLIREFALSTPFDISTRTQQNTFDYSVDQASLRGIAFSKAGDKLYSNDDLSSKVAQYSLGTSWDLSSISLDQKITVSGITLRAISFN